MSGVLESFRAVSLVTLMDYRKSTSLRDSNISATLPDHVKERILTFPEYKMGVHLVALVLKDGSLVEDVLVAWGKEVIRIGGMDGCSIDVVDVVDAQDRS